MKLNRSKWLMTAAAALAISIATPDSAYACRAIIGDFVWLDANGNGAQDSGEAGIAGVAVSLVSTGGIVLATVLTDANGYYTFSEVEGPPNCEQTYVVRAAAPAGLTTTLIGVGDPGSDSNDPTGTFVTPSDTTGTGLVEDLTIDFGFVAPQVCTASIGNVVWNDSNNDGRQDAGELGIPNNVVSLSGPAGSMSVATNVSGLYSFNDLCAGTYVVCADTPAGFQSSPTDAAGDDAVDSDGTPNGTGQSCVSVTVSGSEANNTIDFGFWMRPQEGPGTGTPGYWKNHPEAWPVESIVIGGTSYTQADALEIMGMPDGDKTITIFRALVAAKLNVLIGNDASCIASTISSADAWMSQYGPAGSRVKAKSLAWKLGEPLYWELDAYNNGDRCAPARD